MRPPRMEEEEGRSLCLLMFLFLVLLFLNSTSIFVFDGMSRMIAIYLPMACIRIECAMVYGHDERSG